MQQIAMLTLAVAAFGTLMLLGWLWRMETQGRVPAWVRKMHDAREEQNDGVLY